MDQLAAGFSARFDQVIIQSCQRQFATQSQVEIRRDVGGKVVLPAEFLNSVKYSLGRNLLKRNVEGHQVIQEFAD